MAAFVLVASYLLSSEWNFANFLFKTTGLIFCGWMVDIGAVLVLPPERLKQAKLISKMFRDLVEGLSRKTRPILDRRKKHTRRRDENE